jgi:hypothetical protein
MVRTQKPDGGVGLFSLLAPTVDGWVGLAVLPDIPATPRTKVFDARSSGVGSPYCCDVS